MHDHIPAIVILGCLLVLYLAPALAAYERHHHDRLAIAVLNVLLGWSILGWIGALVWACTAVRRPPPSPSTAGTHERTYVPAALPERWRATQR
jgi:Superinfection immunity protein